MKLTKGKILPRNKSAITSSEQSRINCYKEKDKIRKIPNYFNAIRRDRSIVADCCVLSYFALVFVMEQILITTVS